MTPPSHPNCAAHSFPALTGLTFLLFAASMTSAKSPYTLAELRGPAMLPKWAQPFPVTVVEDKPWTMFSNSHLGTRQMRRGAAQLHYATRTHKASGNYPFWLFSLGQHFADLGQDAPAYQCMAHLIGLSTDTAYTKSEAWLPTLAAVKRHSRFTLLRIVARNGIEEEAKRLLAGLPSADGYDAIRKAEALALLGDTEEALALLPQARGNGHPEENFSNVLLISRAVTLARVLGDDELAKRLAGPLLARGLHAEKWPQWMSSWAVMKRIVNNAQRGPLGKVTGMRDGTYKGECRGFIAPIRVAVGVKSGRIAEVSILEHKEKRSWSVFTVIPKRICRRQDLAVDAVTGATITGCAVVAAVDQALASAAD